MSRLPNKNKDSGMTRRGFLIAMTAVGVSFGFPRTSWSAMDPATEGGALLPDNGSLYEPSLWYSIDAKGKSRSTLFAPKWASMWVPPSLAF